MVATNFISLYEKSFKQHWGKPALDNYQGNSYSYAEVAQKIASWHLLFERIGLVRQDKVALLAKDSAEWCIFFVATITYGAVIVPILQDFSADDARGIINHSDSKLLLADAHYWQALSAGDLPLIENVIDLHTEEALFSNRGINWLTEQLQGIPQLMKERYPNGYSADDVAYYQTPNEEMLLLNYTSGTTGFSKGVMVSGNNMAGNVCFCIDNKIVRAGERLLCFLPLAHTYSCMIHLQLAIAYGVHVTILGRKPVPQILRKAFAEVRPDIIISVPLVLEKIYLGSVAPLLQTAKMKLLLSLPIVKNAIYRKIRNKLLDGMGGKAREVIVGGAALNPEVGAFLKKIGFPITVGYGMTECAPLISYIPNQEWRLGSCGRVLQGYMEARIATKDEETGQTIPSGGVGEIQVRGENVCMGYYKNEEQTQALFTEDGWMHTGDLGTKDKDNFLYIRGRSKAMLLSGSGQNIYPEEIEAKINLIPYVQESIVLMRENKLEALVVLNSQAVEEAGLTTEEAWSLVQAQRQELNEKVGSYEKVQRFHLHPEPFEKTPKQSIKRFLYS